MNARQPQDEPGSLNRQSDDQNDQGERDANDCAPAWSRILSRATIGVMKRLLKLMAAVVLPALTIGLIVSEHAGWWDRYFGLTNVLDVAKRFETSYAESVNRQIRPGDPAWGALNDLIRRYSTADLPPGREPKVFARFVAVASSKIDLGDGKIAEWTAPSTPVVLIYDDWPGQSVPPSDYRIVGTIGDLRVWVDKRRSDFHFLARDVLVSLTSVILGLVVWIVEHRSPK
jgi:hypothetical protein